MWIWFILFDDFLDSYCVFAFYGLVCVGYSSSICPLSFVFLWIHSLLCCLRCLCAALLLGWDLLFDLSLCWYAVWLSLDIQPNRILLVTIHHMLYPITVEVLHQVFSPHGFVEKIVTFQKSAGQHLQILSFLSFFIWYWLRRRISLMRNTSLLIDCDPCIHKG